MTAGARPNTLPRFLAIWLGQMLSLVGTGVTAFAMSIWVFRTTGKVTPLALVSVFQFGAMTVLSPLAGVVVDRWDKRWVMVWANVAGGAGTLLLLLLHSLDRLQVWHLCATAVVAGASNAFHLTAYSSSIPSLVPKAHFTRASSLISLGEPASSIFAPIIAGALLGVLDVRGVLLVDVASFVVAIGTLLAIPIPAAPIPQGAGTDRRFTSELVAGFRYIVERASLLAVTMLVFAENLLNSFASVVQGPLILVRSHGDAGMMATVLSTEAAGGVAGGVLLGVWGGARKHTRGIQLGIFVGGALGLVVMALGRLPVFWLVSAFFAGFHIPLVVNSYRTILLTKVPPGMQGKVLGSARLISAISIPLSMVLAAPLIDFVLEPAMEATAPLAAVFGPLLGTGKGAGMSLLYLLCGGLCLALSALFLLVPSIRNADAALPDYDVEQGAVVGRPVAEVPSGS